MAAPDGLAVLAALFHPMQLDASALTQSTFSAYRAVLAKAALVSAGKRGRQQVQRARLETRRQLTTFVAKDCCQGHPELCKPLIAELACC